LAKEWALVNTVRFTVEPLDTADAGGGVAA
jgi:hypothetical protein